MTGKSDTSDSQVNPYASTANTPLSLSSAETGVVWTIWLTYGAFYFCRTNIGVALPGIEAELGYTKTTMGIVLLSLKIAYAVGQFVNGQLSERFPPRVLLAIGMFTSAALNIAFGFGTALYFFLFVWACNGYFQSLGWTPCMRVIGNWIPFIRRGKAIGIIGTGYQAAAAVTFAISGVAASLLGWRGIFFVSPAILTAAGVFMLVMLREQSDEPLEGTADRRLHTASPGGESYRENLMLTLSNPALWLLAAALGMLNACRYGFLDWGVSHLVDIEKTDGAINVGTSTLKAAVKYAVLPIGGILGSFIAGWATDRFFAGRRAPVICGLLVSLGLMALVYDQVARSSFVGTMILLLLIGFSIYGPQVLLVGTAPTDLARRGTAAAAAGFVNSVGYFGAAIIGDYLTGHLVDNYGWQTAIYAWSAWAFIAAILVALLWNATGQKKDDDRHQSQTDGADRNESGG